ncbi:MAG: hypothetical protein WC043_05265 [Pseudobdellovibrionaceae bacterium]
MTTKLEKLGASLMIAFALAGCGESQFDVARKPELVDAVTSQSMEVCQINEPAGRDADYQMRLRAVLSGAESRTLDYIKTNGITVCLDARLPAQQRGMWDHRLDAVYYGGKEGRVIGLWDNGIVGEGRSVWSQDTSDYGANFLDKFAKHVWDGDIHLTDHFAFGGRYGCGKGCTTERWKAEGDFDRDTIAKNPSLLKAPVVQAVPATPAVPSYDMVRT